MTDVRGNHGYFDEGTRPGPGRPKGARNKPPELKFLEEVLRYGQGRRFRGLTARLVEDLGGPDALSTAEKVLFQRCAMIADRMRAHGTRGAQRRNFGCDRVLNADGAANQDAQRGRNQTPAKGRDADIARLHRGDAGVGAGASRLTFCPVIVRSERRSRSPVDSRDSSVAGASSDRPSLYA